MSAIGHCWLVSRCQCQLVGHHWCQSVSCCCQSVVVIIGQLLSLSVGQLVSWLSLSLVSCHHHWLVVVIGRSSSTSVGRSSLSVSHCHQLVVVGCCWVLSVTALLVVVGCCSLVGRSSLSVSSVVVSCCWLLLCWLLLLLVVVIVGCFHCWSSLSVVKHHCCDCQSCHNCNDGCATGCGHCTFHGQGHLAMAATILQNLPTLHNSHVCMCCSTWQWLQQFCRIYPCLHTTHMHAAAPGNGCNNFAEFTHTCTQLTHVAAAPGNSHNNSAEFTHA